MKEETVHRIMVRVLRSGLVAPDIKLAEFHLSQKFDISRDRMRRVLQRLGHEKLLNLVPNRGARTIAWDFRDIREIYAARRIFEGGIIMAVADRVDDGLVARLEAQNRQELNAVETDNVSLAVTLGGALHNDLAEATRNQLVTESLQAMVERTSIALDYFGPSGSLRCSCREHGEIISALKTGNPTTAREAMCDHLSLIETRLSVEPRWESVGLDELIEGEIEREKRHERDSHGCHLDQDRTATGHRHSHSHDKENA
ncbi:GntR family transcriptional regulator [Jiella pelagia]|uniref:GntR family transcriptional regulator n=1 Tax=Jiella pelagia TaxID=2986949 RepID=A0ABY7BWG6_9HYPH|nr:GntR family transcriptional regulator [Jiella pelagia]WAP67718.1 GntR family transcriptional regulator [Jiella pelagia]